MEDVMDQSMGKMNVSILDRLEPRDIRWMRICLKHWPLPRGKGILMRLFKPRLRNRDFLMQVEPGIMVPADLEDYIIYWCFVHGYETDPAVQLSRALIHQGDTVVDVGANIGLWTMGAARQAGQEGRLHAFEPVPENFTRLIANLNLNGFDLNRVQCQQLSLSDRSGRTVFYLSTNGNSGMGALAQRDGVNRPIETRLIALDDYCEKHSISRVDFIKIDVEGAELLVLRGAKGVLASAEAPAIVFEADDSLAASFGSSSSAVKTLLAEKGYEIFRYDGRRLEHVEVNQKHRHEDLFAFKPDHFQLHPVLRELHKK
jgi:FkbM family methyltransferase